MSRTDSVLHLDGIDVSVVRKDVKHVRISVHPPEGRVRVSVPRHVTDSTLRHMLTPRLPWIRRKRAEAQRVPHAQPELVTGEIHPFRGRHYRLLLTEGNGAAGVRLAGDDTMELRVPHGSDRNRRAAVLEKWYRLQLHEAVQPLLDEWAPRLGVSVAEVRIRRMTTRWGSCNTRARRIWLNLELIKRSDACLEYVLVHELVHLLEGSHSQRFWRLMDEFMPQWRQHRAALKGTL